MNDLFLYSVFRITSKEITLSNYNRLAELRNSFVRNRNLIEELDQSLS